MPLSEYEQRMLQQMEQQLRSDDPKLASTLAERPRLNARRLLAGVLLVVAGLGLLVGGVAIGDVLGVVVGVLGFGAMLGGVLLTFSRTSRPGTPGSGGSGGGGGKAPRRSGPSGGGFMQRQQDRWDRRREQGGR